MSDKQPIISADTLVPLGFVMVMVGAIWSFGVLWQKTETLKEEVAYLRQDVKLIGTKVDTILGRLNAISYGK